MLNSIDNFTINVDLSRFMLCKRTEPRPALFLEEYQNVDLVNFNSFKTQTIKALGFALVKYISNVAAYHAQLDIYYNSDYVGFILTDKTKKYGINSHLIPMHIDNKALYTLPLHEILPKFMEVFDLQVSNESQIDIAIDSHDDLWQMITYYTSQPEQYQRVKHKNDKGFRVNGTICEVTGKQDTTVSFGTKTGLKNYNKTLELLKNPKPYITAFHNANDLNPQKDIYRSEILITAKSLKHYDYKVVSEDGELISKAKFENSDSFYNNEFSKGHKDTNTERFDLTRINDKAYLLTLFSSYFPINIRIKDRAKLSKCTHVQLINFDKYPKATRNIMTVSTIVDENKIKEKRRIKENVVDYIRTNDIEYLTVASKIADRFGLQHDYKAELKKCFNKGVLSLTELAKLLNDNSSIIMSSQKDATEFFG